MNWSWCRVRLAKSHAGSTGEGRGAWERRRRETLLVGRDALLRDPASRVSALFLILQLYAFLELRRFPGFACFFDVPARIAQERVPTNEERVFPSIGRSVFPTTARSASLPRAHGGAADSFEELHD